METAPWIFFGLLIAFMVVIFAIVGYATIQQRRTPVEQRHQQVLEKLRAEESPTGTTSILSGYRVGVKDDMVRSLADTEGYEWTGYSGRNDRRLNFQRKLPDQGQR